MKKPRLDATVQACVDLWSTQKRRIWLGGAGGHVDGYSVRTVLGRLKDEADGASQPGSAATQRWSEVFTGDALAIEIILNRLPYGPRMAFNGYYLFRGGFWLPIRVIIAAIGTGRTKFWDDLGTAESRVSRDLPLVTLPANETA
jgi:hypothetical protein